MNRPRYYRLDAAGEPVPCADIDEWAEWMEHRNEGDDPCRVSLTEYADGMSVSTVFLGLDHGVGQRPMIFETMIFGNDGIGEFQERYSTRAEAESGHAKAVALVEAERLRGAVMFHVSPRGGETDQ